MSVIFRGIAFLSVSFALAAACSDNKGEPNGASGELTASIASYAPSASDQDGDGADDSVDNCYGVPNPDQLDTDHGISTDVELSEDGDACDDDIDGDEVENQDDDFPRDTDNDGLDNPDDDDDDGDEVPDPGDNCPLVPNEDQLDTDDDGGGDKCDADDDDDGFADWAEQLVVGSNALDSKSTPEYVGVDESCVDGMDNDLDTLIDENDPLCADSDDDRHPDERDNCPEIGNRDQFDPDEDRLGAECDPDNDNDGVPDEGDACPDMAIGDEVDANVDTTGRTADQIAQENCDA